MRSAAISRLKASLSEYIDVVKAGEELLVTDRGKPVARSCRSRRSGDRTPRG